MDNTNPPALLDLDLNSIDTSFTVVKSGMYDLIVKESSVEKTSSGEGDMWVVKLATIKEAMTQKDGSVVAPGHTLFHRVGLTQTDKYTLEGVAKNVARVVQAIKPAVLGISVRDLSDGSFATKCKLFEGRMLQAKVEALPEGRDKKTNKSLPPRNELSQFVKAT